MAVSKAGGAYVPVDPFYPPERVALLLTEAQAPVQLVQPHRREMLRGGAAATIEVDLPSLRALPHSNENLEGGAGLDDLCYIIFTSGSTGGRRA